MKLIAKGLAKWHALPMLESNSEQTVNSRTQTSLLKTLRKMILQLPTSYADPIKQKQFSESIHLPLLHEYVGQLSKDSRNLL